ncbi:hypothetical protein OGAPHI_001770 [Ogataea philodendri]|uniref:Uncharacterized protein n=1 Tax=Ogataea philodendri TaxID=1378263 RepID=A0A9P8T7I6_9ASCO|nr:uncharacterized protein OGAPHI_001770 [Ogataea philodendri]KAH3668016.1 hypothetical protein OGAPHI_001770 [Ogataea philodendri]
MSRLVIWLEAHSVPRYVITPQLEADANSNGSVPLSNSFPCLMSFWPAKTLNKVDFPAPFGPTSRTLDLGLMSRLTSNSPILLVGKV